MAAVPGERDAPSVRSMFDRIAVRYDLLNTILSAGADGRWRRQAARAAGLEPGGAALDVACGSGRLTGELARLAGPRGRVVGLDFSPRMLDIARRDQPELHFLEGDALQLPFADGEFDATTMAFGLRNLADPGRGLDEMRRVVHPSGRMVVLEFVRPPRNLIGGGYRLYLTQVLPRVGGLLSGDRAAYAYLSETVDSYRTPEQLCELATRAGWLQVEFRGLMLGTVGLLTGIR